VPVVKKARRYWSPGLSEVGTVIGTARATSGKKNNDLVIQTIKMLLILENMVKYLLGLYSDHLNFKSNFHAKQSFVLFFNGTRKVSKHKKSTPHCSIGERRDVES